MKILIAVLMIWLPATLGLPAVHEKPGIKFFTQQKIVALGHGASTPIPRARSWHFNDGKAHSHPQLGLSYVITFCDRCHGAIDDERTL